jgi:hypothetical protein
MRHIPPEIGTLHFIGIGGIGMSGIAEVCEPWDMMCREAILQIVTMSLVCASRAFGENWS